MTEDRPRIVLFQPDIPGIAGTNLRLAVCLDLAVDIIEPAGFRLDHKSLCRSGMDYADRTVLTRHDNWEAFEIWRAKQDRRLILVTTKGDTPYSKFSFLSRDCLIFGRESAGATAEVHHASDAELVIPMANGERSLNLAMSVAMVVGEAIRQVG